MKYSLKIIFTIIGVVLAIECAATGFLIPVTFAIKEGLKLMWKED